MSYITVGGQEEEHQIEIDLSEGEFKDLELIEEHLILKKRGSDSKSKPVYAKQGVWTSNIIDLKHSFKNFHSMTFQEMNNNKSSFIIHTSTSHNKEDWSEWEEVNGSVIQSPVNRFLIIKISFFAGMEADLFSYTAKSENIYADCIDGFRLQRKNFLKMKKMNENPLIKKVLIEKNKILKVDYLKLKIE